MVNKHLKKYLILIGLFLISIILTIELYSQNNLISSSELIDHHTSIIHLQALSPYKYRILSPFLIEGIIFLLPFDYEISLLISYQIFYFISILLFLFVQFNYYNNWFNQSVSFFGILLSSNALYFTFEKFGGHPWAITEVIFIVLFLDALFKNKFKLVIFVLLLASLNRETAVILPIIYFLVTKNKKNSIILFAIWLFIFVSFRLILGVENHVISLNDIYLNNISAQSLLILLQKLFFMFGLIVFLILISRKSIHVFHKRTIPILIPYLGLISFWGVWVEVRLFIALLPLLIPMSLPIFSEAYKIERDN